MLRDERVGLEAGQLKAEGWGATKIAEKAGISRISSIARSRRRDARRLVDADRVGQASA